ncbi:MAG: hypothetical protein A2277_18790 [Desulfobacterales bacterium RIFOXYA12_FULL_46_15]|nr:MAG: hypothetical protein A2277_18790 [Desulfobacterales bacterium RIFOXYA12_FULL_46_15]
MCRGLSAIDTDLVEGFTATVDAVHGQTRILDSRIFQVGKAIVGQMEQENHLTRGTIQEVGRHFVDAVQRGGAMTRQSLFDLSRSILNKFEGLTASLAERR